MRRIGWNKMKMNASMGSQWEAKNFAFFGWRKNLYKMVLMEDTKISL